MSRSTPFMGYPCSAISTLSFPFVPTHCTANHWTATSPFCAQLPSSACPRVAYSIPLMHLATMPVPATSHPHLLRLFERRPFSHQTPSPQQAMTCHKATYSVLFMQSHDPMHLPFLSLPFSPLLFFFKFIHRHLPPPTTALHHYSPATSIHPDGLTLGAHQTLPQTLQPLPSLSTFPPKYGVQNQSTATFPSTTATTLMAVFSNSNSTANHSAIHQNPSPTTVTTSTYGTVLVTSRNLNGISLLAPTSTPQSVPPSPLSLRLTGTVFTKLASSIRYYTLSLPSTLAALHLSAARSHTMDPTRAGSS